MASIKTLFLSKKAYMIKHIRAHSQQLVNPQFDSPKELVSWMGAMQAQEYNMMKWAVGMRLKDSTLSAVNESLHKGEIIRTHILRPTWHLVSPDDIRWMLNITSPRIKPVIKSYYKALGVSEDQQIKLLQAVENALDEHDFLTRQEIADELIKKGTKINSQQELNCVISYAEMDGIVCSGGDKNKKATYALLEKRVPPTNDLNKEEALSLLARKYFQSHSPATIEDFTWWSGLSLTETRLAIKLIESELTKDNIGEETYFIHQSCAFSEKCENLLHFMPPYDEFLISYKDRTPTLDKEHYPKAFNTFGIFYPVIMYNGKIVGNWKKVKKKGQLSIDITLFNDKTKLNKNLLKKAEKRYMDFHNI